VLEEGRTGTISPRACSVPAIFLAVTKRFINQ
jgi:hypothetical protein